MGRQHKIKKKHSYVFWSFNSKLFKVKNTNYYTIQMHKSRATTIKT